MGGRARPWRRSSGLSSYSASARARACASVENTQWANLVEDLVEMFQAVVDADVEQADPVCVKNVRRASGVATDTGVAEGEGFHYVRLRDLAT